MGVARFIPIACLLISGFAIAQGKGLTFQQARFLYHPKTDYERFVLEFSGKRSQSPVPEISLQQSGTTFTVEVKKLSLLEDIPEQPLVQAYSSQSRYLGEVRSLRRNETLTVSLAVKKNTATIEVFWLNSPPRLVFDVFGDSSRVVSNVRHKAIVVAVPEKTSSEPTLTSTAPREVSHSAAATNEVSPPSGGAPMENGAPESQETSLSCYPIEAGRIYSTVLPPEDPKAEGAREQTPRAPSTATESSKETTAEPLSKGVVCYPKSAAISPK